MTTHQTNLESTETKRPCVPVRPVDSNQILSQLSDPHILLGLGYVLLDSNRDADQIKQPLRFDFIIHVCILRIRPRPTLLKPGGTNFRRAFIS
jgi:hypothetical protein